MEASVKAGLYLLVLAGTALPISASASVMSGNAIYNICERNKSDCGFIVIGMFDMLYYVDKDRRECFPEPLTVRQIQDVFVRFLDNNPARRSYTAASLFRIAVREAWPCD